MKLNDSWELIGRRMRGLRRQYRITLREAADEVRKLRGHRIDLDHEESKNPQKIGR